MDQARLFELKMTVLKMASDMLTNEYVDKKAENHNQWLIQNETLWRTQGMRVPYPAFPPYPTQAEVLKKADQLWKCFVLDEAVQKEMKELPNVGSNDGYTACVDVSNGASAQSTRLEPEASAEETIALQESLPVIEAETALPRLEEPIDAPVDYPVTVHSDFKEVSEAPGAPENSSLTQTSEPNANRGLAGFGNWLLRKTA